MLILVPGLTARGFSFGVNGVALLAPCALPQVKFGILPFSSRYFLQNGN